MSNLFVAHEIRNQLGQMAFVMMGARNLAGGDNFLQFSIGNNSKKVNKIRITLEPSDIYRITFMGRTGKVLSEVSDVYCDMLHNTIEENTGMYLSL